MKKLIASVAAAGLALTPLMAQANTRAAESNVALTTSPLAAERIGASVEGEELVGVSPIVLIIGAVAIVWGAIEIIDSKGILD